MEVSLTSLPAHVMNALDAIWEGSIADSLGSETLEFKEDPACAGRGKQHGNPQAALIEKLIDEAVCLANGDAGTGHIVVGIKDKIGGTEAFTGTTFDTEKILLGSGRDIPDVHTEDTFVEVILHSGNPDESFIKALHELSLSFNPDMLHSVNTLIVLWHLWTSPVISLKQARVKTQTSSKEATELMFALESNGLLTQIHNTDEWFLSEKARKTTNYYQSETIPQSSVQTWVEEKLSSGSPISAAEIAESIGMPRPEITEILRNLRRAGKAHIDPSGPQRGSGTRWIKGK